MRDVSVAIAVTRSRQDATKAIGGGHGVPGTVTAVHVDPNVVWHDTTVSRADRWARLGWRGATVWFTGLSGSGKSTVANAVAELLHERGRPSYVLDGDNIRHGLNADLGFSAADRAENVRRVGEVARLVSDAGLVALVPLISPYRADRDRVRAIHVAAGLPFCEVHLDVPLEVCEARDPKGLYAKARAGELTGFTGVDDPYEAPASPELRLTADGDPGALARRVLGWLDEVAS
jgi:bifunctional enzyme CysN/CysC